MAEISTRQQNEDRQTDGFSALYSRYSGITDRLPADSPKFSSPITSAVMIRQKFPLQNFPMYSSLRVSDLLSDAQT